MSASLDPISFPLVTISSIVGLDDDLRIDGLFGSNSVLLPSAIFACVGSKATISNPLSKSTPSKLSSKRDSLNSLFAFFKAVGESYFLLPSDAQFKRSFHSLLVPLYGFFIFIKKALASVSLFSK